ncbi:lytic transglycosylase domain-containing protein [Yoonia sp. R2331]|uniref:lytic transglycosylase domain-containing protein n=1 Tax=Yoonia sp. R2331 TaxID=3237238 RepID=UPI0034E53330
MACANPVFAEGERLQPDFTFKRVGVPSGNAGSRITVQVDPSAAPATVAPAPAVPDAPQLTGLEWFWQDVSPDLDDSGPGRLEQAILAMGDAPAGKGVPAPRLQTLQEIAQAHGLDILRETVGTDVSPALVLALIAIESSGKSDATSSAGAHGLMQLMPATAARFGVTDTSDPSQNIKGGVAYLSWLMGHFDGDPILVLAGYNAGEGAVRDHAGVPPYPETRAYVPKVLAAFNVAKGLCKTPPELVSDGCVFAVSGS